MAVDWIKRLQEQGEHARKMVRDVTNALSHRDLSLDQAQRLYKVVEQGAQNFDQMSGSMQEYDLDESLYEAADALEGIWAELSVATANRVRTMQGLSPIEIAPLDDD